MLVCMYECMYVRTYSCTYVCMDDFAYLSKASNLKKMPIPSEDFVDPEYLPVLMIDDLGRCVCVCMRYVYVCMYVCMYV